MKNYKPLTKDKPYLFEVILTGVAVISIICAFAVVIYSFFL